MEMDHTLSDGTRSKYLQRSTSLQKIMHICNQGRQVFPYIFLRFQDFQISLGADLRKIIPRIKSLLVLQLGIYFSICLLYFEVLCCLVFSFVALPSDCAFLLSGMAVVSLMSFQTLQNFHFGQVFRRTLFVKRKSE